MIPDVILGIDPSLTSTGWCLLERSEVKGTGCIQTTSAAVRPLRLNEIRAQLLRMLYPYDGRIMSILVAMEAEIWMGGRGHEATDQFALQAILQDAFFHLAPQPEFLSVNVWHVKKFLGAKLKDEVLLKTYKLFNREFRDHNQADAFVIAHIADVFAHYRDGTVWQDTTKAQAEVLDKLLAQPKSWDVLKRWGKGKR